MRNETESRKSLKENGLKCGVINCVFIIVRYFISHFVSFNFYLSIEERKKKMKRKIHIIDINKINTNITFHLINKEMIT